MKPGRIPALNETVVHGQNLGARINSTYNEDPYIIEQMII